MRSKPVITSRPIPIKGRGNNMSSSPPVTPSPNPSPPAPAGGAPPDRPVSLSPWLAALAVVPILTSVYQTLVLTDVTDDVIRKGLEAEHYSMIWTNLCWGVAIIYGVFAALWS